MKIPNKDAIFPDPWSCFGSAQLRRPIPRALFFFLVVFLRFHGVLCCDELDRDGLVSFFGNLSSNPSLNWSISVDCCFWEGVGCGGDRVVSLSLPGRGISGGVSGGVMNLTRLSHLNLSHNSLRGPLPVGFFSSLTGLRLLDLSSNRLSGDPQLNVSGVETLDLSSNRFNGQIPLSFFEKASNLTVFNISSNSFTGAIPPTLCSGGFPAKIKVLDFSSNDFSGEIPGGLAGCSRLESLRLGFNNLSGSIPDDIYKIKSLTHLSLPANQIQGSISGSISELTNLTTLELYSNRFTGSIPPAIGNLTNLDKLLLHINFLTGPLPMSLTNCSKLTTLNLRVNFLEGNITNFNFSGLPLLVTLDLGNNNLSGPLPISLYSCKSLTAVRFASNRIEGQISSDILELHSLSFLSLSNNTLANFTGAMTILSGCKSLGTLILSKTFFREPIHADESLVHSGGFPRLQVLGLGGCEFTGEVPEWLVKLESLEVLDLSQNSLTGRIPAWLGSMRKLFYIDLSDNELWGEIPIELSNLMALSSKQADDTVVDRSYLELPVFVMPNNVTNQQYNQLASLPPAIYLRNNNLSGPIPRAIAQLKFLLVLDLSYNSLSGAIPDELSSLTNLEKLYLSNNNLSGRIPPSLGGLHFLSSFSVAFNELSGGIPSGGQFDTFPASSFQGNPQLCGAQLLNKCNQNSRKEDMYKRSDKKTIVGIAVGIFFGTGFVISVLALWILAKRRVTPRGDTDRDKASPSPSPPPEDTGMVQLFREIKNLSIAEILKATDNFDQANIVGCGGFGLVYKATFENGIKLAVKKLSGDMGMMEREFRAEVQALSTAQHENLVSLQGYCAHDCFRLLIYTYMENGSLDFWLHEKPDGAAQLLWPARRKILQGAARGLEYMHLTCDPHIVHRDIKSSNILLDGEFEAHVADFGLSRLINPYCTHVTTELVGTLGYIPPEYGQAWTATLRGDMYSFGVVMLELLSGRRPMEVFGSKMARELVPWALRLRSEGKEEEVFDPVLRGKGFGEEMREVLDVACACVSHDPAKRPTIGEVVGWLAGVGAT